MRRLSWIIQWTQCSHKDPYKREEGEVGVRGPCDHRRDGKQSRREHCANGDGDGGGAASQGMLAAPDAARGKGIHSPPQPPERTSPSNSLILAL